MERYIFRDEARNALEALPQPLAVYQRIDSRIVTLLVSDGFCRMLGYKDRNQAVYDMDHNMYKDTHPDDVRRISDAARQFSESDGEYDVVYRTTAGVESDYRVIHAHGKHEFPVPGIRLAYVWYMDEGVYIEGEEASGTRINREMNSTLHEESILRSANYDVLTGLPNLAYFFKLCEIGKARLLNEGKQGVLLYIDMNGMKYYNHRNGYAEGDQMLKSFAALLSDYFGIDNCCHINADRFAASTLEENLEERLRKFFELNEQLEKHLPLQIGIYSTDVEDVPVSTAYDRAKVACDKIHKSEKSAFLRFSIEMSDGDKKRRYILTNVDKAIAERWVKVYYQPIVRAVNLRVCDEEALARWIDPENGFLSPADFIPHLEEAGLIYKIDLFVLETALERMRQQREAGLAVVPISINLSRSDFEACDIVEEVRKRVDDAGEKRSMITIEITESTIGNHFNYMKGQIERFRELGFPVWMDDFGSGYSSLDVLQSIEFDLIKFDMSFMRRLNEGESAKIVLTELMKMAASLGVDTICEGVETEEQVIFLQEIGCSKLQGYYFCKPVPYEEILARYSSGRQIGFEDTDTSSYFEAMGRINLYNLDEIASWDGNEFQNSFDTIPTAIIEIRGETARIARSNPSYREFMGRFQTVDLNKLTRQYVPFDSQFMQNISRTCREPGKRIFFNEKMPDGTTVHSFARWIGENPKTGDIAVAVAVLSITESDSEDISSGIARALAEAYYHLFVVDMETEEFTDYTSLSGKDHTEIDRYETDFFHTAVNSLTKEIYEEDREPFAALLSKDNILWLMNTEEAVSHIFRYLENGTVTEMLLTIMRMPERSQIMISLRRHDPESAA